MDPYRKFSLRERAIFSPKYKNGCHVSRPGANVMRRMIVVLVVVFALATTAGAQQPLRLTILHTSEHHGSVLPFDIPGGKGVGGVAARASVIAQVRQEVPNILLVDSGDILLGTEMSSVFRGEPDILAMNLMRYDAMAAGNHEFDYGLEHFRRLQQLAKFPIISTSIRARAREIAPIFVVTQVAGIRVLIFSGISEQTFPESMHPALVREVEYFDPISSARGLIRGIGRSVDLIVALTHMQTDQDLALARAVPQIHVIVGGHTLGFDGMLTATGGRPVDVLTDPPTFLVKTHRLGVTVGRLDLEIAGGRVRRAVARNLPVSSQVSADPQVAALVKDYEGRLKAGFSEVIGRAAALLDGERNHVWTRETNLGNLLADMLRDFGKTELAIINGGGIRGSLAGPITLGDAFRVLPLDTTVVTLQLTGAQVREALENGMSQVEQGRGRFPQVSGMTLVLEGARPVGQRVVDVRVGGQPLDPGRMYSLATTDFLAGGGDGYSVFRAGKQWRDTQRLLRDLFVEFVRRHGAISAAVEGRIMSR